MEDREYKYLGENHISISKKELENMFNDKEKNKDKIIRSQFAMVLMLVSKFSHTTGHSTSNLISYALEGLYKAYKCYDRDRGNNGFSQFASYAIRNNMIILNNHSKTTDKDIISIPISQNNTICNVFTDMIRSSDDVDYFENTLAADDETEHRDIEDELIQLIKDSLKKEMWSDIVIKRMGIGLDNVVPYKILSEEYNKSNQSINALYTRGISKLQGNPEFIKKLKKITDS
jgi:hypothetical protein